MQYTLDELRSLSEVLMAELGLSKRALSERIDPQNRNLVVRLFQQENLESKTHDRLSDWFDENWPAEIGWPRDVEQRQAGFRLRQLRQQEARNVAGRKLARFDRGLHELARKLRGMDDARRLVDQVAGILDDMRDTLGSWGDDDEPAAGGSRDTAILRAANGS